jgi:hypothetical protein
VDDRRHPRRLDRSKGLARAVEHYGVAAETGVTLSTDQHNHLRALDLR